MTTLEMNEKFDYDFLREDLIPNGDFYQNALVNNATIIK